MNIRECNLNHPNILNHVEQQRIVEKQDTHVLGLQSTKEDQLSLEPFKQNLEFFGQNGIFPANWQHFSNALDRQPSNTEKQSLHETFTKTKPDMGRKTPKQRKEE